MKTKLVRENMVVFFLFILIAILGIVFFRNIGYNNFKYIPLEDPSKGFEIIGITIFIALVVERALEMLLNIWRDPGKTVIKSILQNANEKIEHYQSKIIELELERKENIAEEQKVNTIDNNIARIREEITTEEKSKLPILKELSAYGTVTKQYAHLTSFFIGIFICLSGFGVLNEFFKYSEFEKTINEDQTQNELLNAALAEYEILDTKLSLLKSNDSISFFDNKNNLVKIENPIKKLTISNLDSLMKNDLLFTKFIASNKNNLQHKIFMILNLLVTALLISGGTEGMHKLAKLYTTFLTGTTKRIEAADNLKN